MNDTAIPTAASPPIRSLSILLEDLKAGLDGDTVAIGALAEALHERGIGMLLLLFAAPMALPLPVPPGINVMLATPLVLLTAQQALGAHTIWLPDRVKNKSFPRARLHGLIDGLIPWMRRIEKLIRPRFGLITQNGSSRICGFLGLTMALTVCIPVPLTNTIPSLGIALMAIGFIMRDGLAVLAGALIGTGWVLMLGAAVTLLGPEAVTIIKETLKAVL